jgi:hypothetical protein
LFFLNASGKPNPERRQRVSVTERNGIEGKECAGCHVWKPLSEFYIDGTKGKSQGFRHCRRKACQAEVRMEQRLRFRIMRNRAVKLGIWDSIDALAEAEARDALGIVDENLRL